MNTVHIVLKEQIFRNAHVPQMPHSDTALVLTLGHSRCLREAARHATMMLTFRMSTG